MVLEQIAPGAIERAQVHAVVAAAVLLVLFLLVWWFEEKP